MEDMTVESAVHYSISLREWFKGWVSAISVQVAGEAAIMVN